MQQHWNRAYYYAIRDSNLQEAAAAAAWGSKNDKCTQQTLFVRGLGQNILSWSCKGLLKASRWHFKRRFFWEVNFCFSQLWIWLKSCIKARKPFCTEIQGRQCHFQAELASSSWWCQPLQVWDKSKSGQARIKFQLCRQEVHTVMTDEAVMDDLKMVNKVDMAIEIKEKMFLLANYCKFSLQILDIKFFSAKYISPSLAGWLT